MVMRRFFAATLVASCLAGCSEDPGLQERVNRLQAETQEKDRQLQEAQGTLEKTKAELKSARAAANRATATPPPAFLPKEQVDDGYTAASKELQRRVAGDLKSYTVEDCIEYPVTMPTDERPYRSKVALLVRSEAGRSYRLEFPVSADAGGKWVFPSADDVAGALADSRTPDAGPAVASSSPTPRSPHPAAQNTASLVPGQTSAETRVIDWGDGRSTNTANRPATNAGTPTPGRSPTPAMPADKDVRIHW